MKMAMSTVPVPVSYINTHGTSTVVGDSAELNAINRVFSSVNQEAPSISSTKSLTGHSLGATGVQETIYCLLMMRHRFITASANIETLDPTLPVLPIVQTRMDNVAHGTILSNSFGFGGTNATLALSPYEA